MAILGSIFGIVCCLWGLDLIFCAPIRSKKNTAILRFMLLMNGNSFFLGGLYLFSLTGVLSPGRVAQNLMLAGALVSKVIWIVLMMRHAEHNKREFGLSAWL